MMRVHFPGGILVIFLLAASISSGQETTGLIQGRVLDTEGEFVPYVNVLVTGPTLQGARGCLGDKNGNFVVPALPVGTYSIHISHVAYQEGLVEGIRVLLGKTTSLGNVQLRSKTLQTEKIHVIGKAPVLDLTSTEIVGILDTRTYESLPLERDYRSIAVLLPQANTSFLGDEINYVGGTGLDNRYFIDGIDVTDPHRGVTGTRLPYNFVQEVEVRTGGYQAEYRSSLGGIVNAITYSGSNEMTGQAFGFFVNNQFAASSRPSFAYPKGGFAFYDVGFGLGGPIKKDALWYYAAYNPTFVLEEVGVPGQGLHDDETTIHSFAGKLTWRSSPRNTLVFTTIGDPTKRHAVGDPLLQIPAVVTLENPDPWLSDQWTGAIHANMEDRFLIRDDMLLRASLSWASFSERAAPATSVGAGQPMYVDYETGVGSGGASEDFEANSRLLIAGLKYTWWRGDHELKAGLEYKDASVQLQGQRWDLLFRYPGDTYIWTTYGGGATTANRIPTFFLQDSWQAWQRLRLNAGVRWDGLFMVDSNGEVAQKILNQWQPRVGFVWRPGQDDGHKISGSYGRYFHDLANVQRRSDRGFGSTLRYNHDPRTDPSGADTLYSGFDTIAPEVEGLQGQHYDEFTLAYERRLFTEAKFGVRGIYRTLRRALENGNDPVTNETHWGNPGYGALSAFPPATRDVATLEISWQQEMSGRFTLLTSYALSRSYGNYPGLYNSDFGFDVPNGQYDFTFVEMLVDGEGLLPNDRTHVFKLAGSYRVTRGLSLGLIGSVMSGTPLSEFGAARNPIYHIFLRQRGTVGRTPWIWDLNLRANYVLPVGRRVRPRLTIDFLHIASQREAVAFDQVHYLNQDAEGNQINPNPTYRMATRYQPPMAVRMGFEVGF